MSSVAWALFYLWVILTALACIGLLLAGVSGWFERRLTPPHKPDLFINRSPDRAVHRPGSVVDFQRYMNARKFS